MAKPGQRQLSVLVIPDDGSRTFEFKISYWLLRIMGGVIGILLMLVLAGGGFYWQALYWEEMAQTLKWDNIRLKSEVARVEELTQVMARMKKIDQQVRDMLSPNLDLPPPNYVVPLFSRSLSSIMETSGQVVSVLGRSGMDIQVDHRWTPSIWPISQSVGLVIREFDLISGVFKGHSGIDIAASNHTSVQAVADGKVIFSGVDDVLGFLVHLDHYGIFFTRYGHLSSILVVEGQKVRKGQPIALVGNLGKSIGSHLHYEVLKDGRPRNPRRYLPQ